MTLTPQNYFLAIVAICAGASCGAMLRFALGLGFNQTLAHMPMGTLSANLIGGFLIGLLLVYLPTTEAVSVEIKLGLVTGFLGSLTTFSTFSAEVYQLIIDSEYRWLTVVLLSHVGGTIAMTVLGAITMKKFLGE